MSDLPSRTDIQVELDKDRDYHLDYDESIVGDIGRAYASGELKTEAEWQAGIDYVAAMVEFKKFWDQPFASAQGDAAVMRRVIDAAYRRHR